MAQSMAWASRHPVWGWPIMLAIMYATYQGVAHVATFMADTLDGVIFGPIVARLDEWLTIPQLNEFLIGDFGLLTMGVMNAVVTVVPILIVFFGILNLLEDVGYLPNLSVMANRTLSKVGLTGKASLSLALGLGCNTMATMTSRMMETKRERIIVSFLIALGVPCAVQLGILIAILSTAPFAALLLVIGTVMATQIVTGLILNRMLPPERHGDFILELPPFRTPVWRFTLLKTYYRVKWFLYEATPLFMLGAVIMFVLEKTGGLVVIERFFDPIITGFLALPIQATEVFILVLSRRELGAAYFKDMVDAGMVDFYQVVVGLTVMTLFIPCISNTMVMIKELGPRWAISINLGIVAIATLVGGALNQFVRAIF
jgi:ferrous iron transport protein B